MDHKYWESVGYFNEIDAGIAPECYGTPNSAPVNMGPRYSSDGAVQAVVRAGAKKIAFDQSNVPGTGYIAAGPTASPRARACRSSSSRTTCRSRTPTPSRSSSCRPRAPTVRVVLNFTPPEALKILQAAQQQGLQDRVKAWGCSTPCNTDFVAKALGSQWDGKLLVNAELNVTRRSGSAEHALPGRPRQYGKNVTGGLGSFSQMGFTDGAVRGRRRSRRSAATTTIKIVNTRIKAVKGFKTDILCKPWYYGDAPLHIPNNVGLDHDSRRTGRWSSRTAASRSRTWIPTIAQVRQIEAKDPSLSAGS